MPYISPTDREFLDILVSCIKATRNINTAGKLNYLFTHIMKRYLEIKGVSYQSYNDIIGALEGAKLELYRRQIGDYENSKINEHGDV